MCALMRHRAASAGRPPTIARLEAAAFARMYFTPLPGAALIAICSATVLYVVMVEAAKRIVFSRNHVASRTT